MDKYKDFATKLAIDAGKIIRKNFTIGMQKEWKEDQTPLTITDTTINKLVIEEIRRIFPDHSIIGEEESVEIDSDHIWICDPLDGTIPFSHGYPTSVFTIALIKNGKPVLGVIYDPFLDRLVIGQKGKGATLNSKAIKVSQDKTIHNRSIINLDCDYQLFKLRESLIKGNDCYVTTLYSAVYAGMLVSFGELLAEVYEYNKPWDGAALKVIIEEAGGKVTDINGNEQQYDKIPINGFVASNGLVHNELLDLIKEIKTPKT